jgi:signal transduction histidine kinase
MARIQHSGSCSGAVSLLAMLDAHTASQLEAELGPQWRLQRVSRIEEALWRLRSPGIAAMLVGIEPPPGEVQQMLEHALQARPEVPLIVVARPEAAAAAAHALEHGAAAVLPCPPRAPLAAAIIERAIAVARGSRAQLQASELEYRERITGLVQSIRHEINNPLTGILGHAEFGVRTNGLDSTVARRFSSIVKLTEDIRGILKKLENSPEDLARLVQR